MIMKYSLFALLAFAFISSFLFPAKLSAKDKELLLIAEVQISPKLQIDKYKIDAALLYATNITQRFKAIPAKVRDSVITYYEKEKNKKLAAIELADELDADYLLFIRVNTIGNLMRIDLIASDGDEQKTGIGYSVIRFRDELTENQIYDPAILAALQRAICNAFEDQFLYEKAQGDLKVSGTQPLIIGGINFKDNEKLENWDLFSKKEVNSYDFVETIFEKAKETEQFIIVDIATRDSMFAMGNLFIIDNFKATSELELTVLNKFDMQYYITGEFIRTAEGADIDLYLCKIIKDKLQIIRKESAKIKNDDLMEMKTAVKETTAKLLYIGAK